jgi:hypothetical protein
MRIDGAGRRAYPEPLMAPRRDIRFFVARVFTR